MWSQWQWRIKMTYFFCAGGIITITYFWIDLFYQCCFDNIKGHGTTDIFKIRSHTNSKWSQIKKWLVSRSLCWTNAISPSWNSMLLLLNRNRHRTEVTFQNTKLNLSNEHYIFFSIKWKTSDLKVELYFASNVSIWRLFQNMMGLVITGTFNFCY